MPQVAGHRLAQRQQPDHVLLDLVLACVNLRVGLHGLGRGGTVALEDRGAGHRDLALHHAAHFGDHVAQALEVLLVALDDMFGALGHVGVLS
jgi:hypothetical protein